MQAREDYERFGKPIREVEVQWDIDDNKCAHCVEKPCLKLCPVEAIYLDPNGNIRIHDSCFGCVLCRNECPYDAITMTTKIAEPIKENVPNINKALCRACGACVANCKTGAIHLRSEGSETFSEIDEDKCMRCGYCYRVCPTDAIKYGEILPRTVKGGKAIVVNHKKCIGCLTCVRVCPSKGSIIISKTLKLPYINPGYCARCEECMHACPSTAIKFSSRKRAYAQYSKIRTSDTISEIVDKDVSVLSHNISRIDRILSDLSLQFSKHLDEVTAENVKPDDIIESENLFELKFNASEVITKKFEDITGSNFKITEMNNLIDSFPPKRRIFIDEFRCIGCGECMNVCPVDDALWLDTPAPVHVTDSCVFCGKCVEACRFDVITIYEESFESKGDTIYYLSTEIQKPREGKLTLSNIRCLSCGVCVNNCPTDALEMVNDKVEYIEDNCIYCRECECLCPVNAIDIDIIKDCQNPGGEDTDSNNSEMLDSDNVDAQATDSDDGEDSISNKTGSDIVDSDDNNQLTDS